MPSPSADALHPFLIKDHGLLSTQPSGLHGAGWRLLLCLLLAGYAWWLPSPVWADARTGSLLVAGFAIAYLAVALPGCHRPASPASGWLARLLDLGLVAVTVASDPLPQAPALASCILLAGLSLPGLLPTGYRLWIVTLLLIVGTALVLRQQLDIIPAGLAELLPTLGITGLIMLWLVSHRQHLLTLQLGQLNTLDEDPVTGLGTRYSLYAAARFLWPLAHRQLIPFTLLYLEITPSSPRDHARTDQLAKLLADCSLQHLRGCDVLTRYDQLGFVYCLPDCQHREAEAIAQRLHTAFEAASVQAGLPATVQIGATWLPEAPRALDDLLHNVIQAVHRARQHPLSAGSGVAYADPEHGRHLLHRKG